MEGFCKWFRHELDDIDFVLNLVWIASTHGGWLIIMMLYYWIFVKRKENKNVNR